MILKTAIQRIPGLDNSTGEFVKNTTPILYDLFKKKTQKTNKQKKKTKKTEKNISHLIS